MSRPRDPRVFYAVCECCDMEFPSRDALVWNERKLARRLRVLESAALPAESGQSPYHEYWVEHAHRVCPTCHADLTAGGKFRALHRSRTKMTVLAVAALLALLIATLPLTLPHLMGMLWGLPGGR